MTDYAEDAMDDPNQVSLSLPLSAYLAALFRAQSFGNLMSSNAFAQYKGTVPAEEEEIIRRFEEGLDNNRFELHGHMSCGAVGDALSHFNDLGFPPSFEAYCDDVSRFGDPADQQLFSSMSPEARQALQEEAATLGKQLLALRQSQLAFRGIQS
ncbi:hypothetical protein [Ralstonia pseudosolanacearum]|uniref:hypothetical protein n=1 Tax=Ralstonia pseudosolanacearum TaxID=1310165 RepID=UPI003CEF2026